MTEHMDVEDYLKSLKKRGKYNNRKVQAEGRTFDSVAEFNHYDRELKLRLLEGSIHTFEFQPEIELIPGFRTAAGKKIRRTVYRADFAFIEASDGIRTVQDVKAIWTPVFKIKYKLLKWRYPDLRFEIIDVKK